MIRQWIQFLLVCLVSLLLGCQSTDPAKYYPIHDIQTTLNDSVAANNHVANSNKPPPTVAQALMPSLSVKAPTVATHNTQRFNIEVNDVPARTFFTGLVDGTPYNIMVDSSVTGTVSLSLKNVTIPEVMDAVREAYGYEYKRTRVGYRIFSSELRTQIFTVNYLNVRRTGASQTEVSTGISSDIGNEEDGDSTSTSAASITPTATTTAGGGTPVALPQSSGSGTSNTAVATHTSSDFWGVLRTSLQTIVGTEGGRSVVINPQAGIVVVRATPAELRKVATYLDSVQNSMSRQVLIEAKVLEITLDEGYQQGINWTLLGMEQLGNNDLKNAGFQAFGSQTDEDVDANIFTGHMRIGGFDATIKLLSTQGNVQVLSSPRIATVNNQKALIKVGKDQFFVTNVSSSTTVGTATTDSQGVELTPFFSGIALDITPQIDGGGNVTLHVHPTVVQVTDDNKEIDLGTQVLHLPLALSTVRETDSIIQAKNGQVVVIGGLMTNFYADRTGMVPGMGQMPVVGTMFRDKERQQQKRELVILLRPVIVNEKSAMAQLKEAQQAFAHMDYRGQEMKKPKSIAHWFE